MIREEGLGWNLRENLQSLLENFAQSSGVVRLRHVAVAQYFDDVEASDPGIEFVVV